MVREDGSRVHGIGVGDTEAEQDVAVEVDPDPAVAEDDDVDPNSNSIVADMNLCRFCGIDLASDNRKMKISDKFLPRAFKNLYGINVLEEQDYIPKHVHQKCFWG